MDIIKKAINKVAGVPIEKIKVENSNSLEHGDYSSNILLILSKEKGISSKEIFDEIEKDLIKELNGVVEKIEFVNPGFINFFLSNEAIIQRVSKIEETLSGKKMLFEYTDPNPFKEFHVGHLMSNAIGESLSRIYEWRGAEVKRANYQGDIGLHVAKAIWGMMSLEKEIPEDNSDLSSKVSFLGRSYSLGSKEYESHEKEIDELNRKIYAKSDEKINELYNKGRKWSLEAFEEIYKKLGTKFDYYFFESDMAERGVEIVKKFIPQVFEESEGAVVFRGENRNPSLHTRVYITKYGLPTYESKDLALHEAKREVGPWDLSVVVTANEQTGVFNVGLEALKEIDREMAEKTKHIAHGMMRLKTGKMSSREGNIITGESLIEDAKEYISEKMKDKEMGDVVEDVAVGAIKYSILKQSPGKDIIYDPSLATSFEGDSGPYLQYTYARINSLMEKGKTMGIDISDDLSNLSEDEKDVLRITSKLNDVVERASDNWSPNLIAGYAIELAGAFNSMYAKLKIIDESDINTSSRRLGIVKLVGEKIKDCLWMLGIKSPDRM